MMADEEYDTGRLKVGTIGEPHSGGSDVEVYCALVRMDGCSSDFS